MGTDNTAIGDRMKRYELASLAFLTPRMPTVLRLDGVAFHTLTKGLERPVDDRFVRAMDETAKALCQRIQGVCCAYVQSDEISILLVDYKRLTSQSWFGKEIQKMVSVSASIAGAVFTTHLREVEGIEKVGYFDSRVIQIPREDVDNYFLWRQRDCIRNSKLSLGQEHFPHKKLQRLSTADICKRLREEKDIDWDLDLTTAQKQGRWVSRHVTTFLSQNRKTGEMEETIRSSWDSIPCFSFSEDLGRNRLYSFLYPDDEEA